MLRSVLGFWVQRVAEAALRGKTLVASKLQVVESSRRKVGARRRGCGSGIVFRQLSR